MKYIWTQRLLLVILAIAPVVIAFLTSKFLLVFTVAFFTMVVNFAFVLEYHYKKDLEKW